ncbi:MarR family winged helix-turn-helix transcriptional regulator [Cellulomonas sp. McL0617]|uniref:MarR family winged helix-turn-helix transcriptional regulator n=1 Tax=Cellulomonas sp. McL0617 TaxID=3415675 RepID=UPI003CF6D25E
MYGTTFPDDELRRFLQQLVRQGGLLEPNHGPAAHLGASASESIALGELSAAGEMSQQELGARLGLEKSTVSRLAAGMEDRGWLSRVRGEDNRRVYRLRLTEQGEAVAERVGAALRTTHEHLLGRLTRQEREALTTGLGALARAMAELHDERPGPHEEVPGVVER